jgi:hypothetical protein
MRYSFGLLFVCALGVLPLVGCAEDYAQCDMIDEWTCWCTKGGPCAFECGEDIEEDCTLWCNPPWNGEIREEPCALDAVNSCTMLCQWGVDCAANCGDDSQILCPYKGRCEASVGDNAGVDCEGGELCDVECRGSCEVTCEHGKCRVHCADPEECIVLCALGNPPVEATLCPDGKTKVCAIECPADTLTASDVGAFEVQP